MSPACDPAVVALPRCPVHRSGMVLITVIGLISLLLSLAIGLTVKVQAGIVQAGNIQKHAQCYIFVQSAIKHDGTIFSVRLPVANDYGTTAVELLPRVGRLGRLQVVDATTIKVLGGAGQAANASAATQEYDVSYTYTCDASGLTLAAIQP